MSQHLKVSEAKNYATAAYILKSSNQTARIHLKFRTETGLMNVTEFTDGGIEVWFEVASGQQIGTSEKYKNLEAFCEAYNV